MKLEIREDSKNYVCTVVKLPVKQKVEGLDKLVKVTIFGNDVLTQKDTDENALYLFFPAECQISSEYLSANNEYRHSNLNKQQGAKPGFFEDNGRVKAIKFKGVISTGYIAPLDTLLPLMDIKGFKEGDEFTDVNGHNLCKKYKVVHQQATSTKESRYNKKLKRFNKLVPNQFRFHNDTSPLAKNLHQFKPEDIIVITDKWHGTSAIFSNVLINKKLSIKEKVAKWLGIDVVTTKHDNLYASRSVIKNQYINEEVTPGYYNEDIWKTVHEEIKDKIEPGISIYGEIVGYLKSGKMIQKGYDYACQLGQKPDEPLLLVRPEPEHKFVVYRITYTKPDGTVIEFSWQQIKNYCTKYSLETVKELYFGTLNAFVDDWGPETFFDWLTANYLEKDCTYCVNKVPAEGIVVRKDGQETYSAYKLKAKRFFERETKQLDEEAKAGEINIEDNA